MSSVPPTASIVILPDQTRLLAASSTGEYFVVCIESPIEESPRLVRIIMRDTGLVVLEISVYGAVFAFFTSPCEVWLVMGHFNQRGQYSGLQQILLPDGSVQAQISVPFYTVSQVHTSQNTTVFVEGVSFDWEAQEQVPRYAWVDLTTHQTIALIDRPQLVNTIAKQTRTTIPSEPQILWALHPDGHQLLVRVGPKYFQRGDCATWAALTREASGYDLAIEAHEVQGPGVLLTWLGSDCALDISLLPPSLIMRFRIELNDKNTSSVQFFDTTEFAPNAAISASLNDTRKRVILRGPSVNAESTVIQVVHINNMTVSNQFVFACRPAQLSACWATRPIVAWFSGSAIDIIRIATKTQTQFRIGTIACQNTVVNLAINPTQNPTVLSLSWEETTSSASNHRNALVFL